MSETDAPAPATAVGLILLAAGRSERMGQPKQLLPYNGRTLLRHAAETALQSLCRPVVVVLGFEADAMRSVLEGLPLQTVIANNWQEGMGASIAAGFSALSSGVLGEEAASLEAAIVMLCDQPLVTADTLDSLIGEYQIGEEGETIVASEFGDAVGAPALFARAHFDSLAHLSGPEGARSYILAHREEASRLIFPAGAVDVDTPEAYNALQRVATDAAADESR